MNAMNLEAMGLVEMNEVEFKQVDGGRWVYRLPGLLKDAYDLCKGYVEHAQRHSDMSETLMNCM